MGFFKKDHKDDSGLAGLGEQQPGQGEGFHVEVAPPHEPAPPTPATDSASPPAVAETVPPAGFQLPDGITPMVYGSTDPERVQEALAKAEQVLGVHFAGANIMGNVGASAPAAAPAPDGTDDMINKLERLAQLHTSGALTDAEFAEQKKKLLGE
jgi:putative oligomerization/nucleic acid binding protein